MRWLIALALPLTAQTMPVVPLSNPASIIGVKALPPAHSIYLVALVRDSGIPSSSEYKATRDLEKQIERKLRDADRVKEVDNEFAKIGDKDCPGYPCEVVVEEVTVEAHKYQFHLELRVIPPPHDKSPQSSHHPGINESSTCTETNDWSANDCRNAALQYLAMQLYTHDQTYHQQRNP